MIRPFQKKQWLLFLAACAAALPAQTSAQEPTVPVAPTPATAPASANATANANANAPAAAIPAPLAAALARNPLISEITIEIEGRRIRSNTTAGSASTSNVKSLSAEADDPAVAAVRAHLSLKKNQPFSQTESDASINALYGTGFYEFVSINPTVNPDNTVHVKVKVFPRLRVVAVNFEGNTEWPATSEYTSALIDESLVRVGDILSDVNVKRSVEKLKKKYEEYYPYAEIEPVIRRNDEEGTASVTFKITEKEVIKIDKLIFEGNYRLADSLLRPEMETSSWAWTFDPAEFPGWRFVKFSWLTDLGRLKKETRQKDVESLLEYYRSQGFLDIEIPQKTVEEKIIESDGHKAWLNLKIRIDEGRRYTIGDIKIEGNTFGALKAGETWDNLDEWRREETNNLNTGTLLDVLATHRNDTTRPYPAGTAPIGSYILDEILPELGTGPRLERRKLDERRRALLSSQKQTTDEDKKEYAEKVNKIETRIRELDERILKLDQAFEAAKEKRTKAGTNNLTGDEIREAIIADLDAQDFSRGEIKELFQVREDQVSLQPGEYYSVKAVEKAIEKIKEQYGQFGYLNTSVEVIRRPDYTTGRVNLSFKVYEGTKTYLAAINIIGNTKTRNRVITREILLEPGDVFDTRRMRNSEMLLRNTRFFDPATANGGVSLQPESTTANLPDHKDLRIEVKEGSTGSVSFGAGFSSVEKLYGYAEFSESNFDIFNWRNRFRGGGQKFRVRVQIGQLSSSVTQSFEEPWVGGRELAMGYEAYLSSNSYASSDYETERLGVNVYARRRVYELVYARLNYTLEDVRLRNVAYSVPDFIRMEDGSKLISKVGLNFYRDNRNDIFFPTYGNYFSFTQNVAGGVLGGDVNYYQLEARATQWIPLFDAADQTLMLLGRVGSMVHYGNGYIPFYEKFNLGGAYDMRGFKYHYMGPFDPTGSEPMGGKSYAFISAEYTIKLFEQLRFAVFYDWGFLNSAAFDFNAKGYNDDAGFGFRILVMGAVMRIDIGWPLTSSKQNDDGVRFNFSFGTQF
jgi:outer membrane protein assembly factor BamA